MASKHNADNSASSSRLNAASNAGSTNANLTNAGSNNSSSGPSGGPSSGPSSGQSLESPLPAPTQLPDTFSGDRARKPVRSIRKPAPSPQFAAKSSAAKSSAAKPSSAAPSAVDPQSFAVQPTAQTAAQIGGQRGSQRNTGQRNTQQARTGTSQASTRLQNSSPQKTRLQGAQLNGMASVGAAPSADNSSIKDEITAYILGMRWLRSWPLFALIIFGVLGTVGTTAVVSLFRIPSLPNCRAVFWPTASASLRLQCAETYAAQGDVKNLLAAIALVDQLPTDHPLRSDIINDRIEDWANRVLDLAEQSFEAGDLEQAISSANKIPSKTAAAEVVEERIERWQRIWQEGNDAFDDAVKKLKEKNFQSAFSLSVKLLDVPNKFWATVKYNELTKLIGMAREDSRKMSKALGLAKEGSVKGFTDALKQLSEISEESVFYAEAQGQRKDIAEKMLVLGENLLANQDISQARAVLAAIPKDVGFDRETEDFQIFVTAYQQAWAGTVGGLENAIKRMKTLKRNRPRYQKGQQLIAQWESELQNISTLAQAQERASRGSTSDLAAAINVAQQIPRNSPQWEDASNQIGQWRSRVETVQDRPILERADRLAASGTPDGLRAAIQEARKVSSGRTLGAEADQRIATWTGRIQRIEDQPVINQARARAQSGDLAGAIAIASRVGEGRALYADAQGEISGWQTQEDGRNRLDEAVKAASRGGADSLANAIEIAQRVPNQSSSRGRANGQINRWSWELLSEAEAVSNRNVESAIALASRIPAQTEAYDAAQIQIGNWRESLRAAEAAEAAAEAAAEEARRPVPAIPVPDRGLERDFETNERSLPVLELEPPPE